MKKYILYIGCLVMFSTFFSCEDFLNKDTLDRASNDGYWTNETALRSYAQSFYTNYFVGYAQDYRTFGGYFSGDSYNDDLLLTSSNTTDISERFYFPQSSTTGINASTTIWTTQYEMIRKANVMLEKIPGMDLYEDVKNHWTGVARFFRAMAYSELVKVYGGVPYIDVAVDPADKDLLYKDRDDQLTVVNKILEDFTFAVNNVRVNDGTLQVHKYLVGGMMSRNMLYFATWLKYHGTTIGSGSQAVSNTDLSKFFQGAITGAEAVMNSGVYGIGNTYNALFSSESLANNPEIVFYREYVYGVFANALMHYNGSESQELGGATANAIESYLCSDGLPIAQSPLYMGKDDPRIEKAFIDRDPRLYDTFVDVVRVYPSTSSRGSYTGYVAKKFLNEEWYAAGSQYVTGLNSPADAPIMRYAEVLLNYVEARYEISQVGGSAFTQADLDKSINVIRKRELTKWGETPAVERTMPSVTLAAGKISVNGTAIEDPERDADVDPVLWEIRRERRIELMLEGRRNDDLKRWAKYEYLNTGATASPNKTNLGAWIKRSDFPTLSAAVVLYDPSNPTGTPAEGYIYAGVSRNPRVFTKNNIDSEKVYLRSIPSTQIIRYEDNGYKLTQNPGW